MVLPAVLGGILGLSVIINITLTLTVVRVRARKEGEGTQCFLTNRSGEKEDRVTDIDMKPNAVYGVATDIAR